MSVYLRDKTWWYQFRFNGVRYMESARTFDQAVAERKERDRFEELKANGAPEGREIPICFQRGSVYFIRCVETNRVKIGWTAAGVKARLSAFQVSCPTQLEVMKSIRARLLDEARIHQLLKPWHVRGEWFTLSSEVERCIISLNDVPDDPADTAWFDEAARKLHGEFARLNFPQKAAL